MAGAKPRVEVVDLSVTLHLKINSPLDENGLLAGIRWILKPLVSGEVLRTVAAELVPLLGVLLVSSKPVITDQISLHLITNKETYIVSVTGVTTAGTRLTMQTTTGRVQ